MRGQKAASPASSGKPPKMPRRGSGGVGSKASAAPPPSPPAPGNNSLYPPWEEASCAQLAKGLLNKTASVWWHEKGQFCDGTIIGGWGGPAGGPGGRPQVPRAGCAGGSGWLGRVLRVAGEPFTPTAAAPLLPRCCSGA